MMTVTINTTTIFALVAAIVTAVSGVMFKNSVVPAKYIPIQNLFIGIISAIVAIYMNIYPSIPVAIFTCLSISMGVGGVYDLTKTKLKTTSIYDKNK